MTTAERLIQIELMHAEMLAQIASLASNLADVSSQLEQALKRISVLEDKRKDESKNMALKIFRNRLN